MRLVARRILEATDLRDPWCLEYSTEYYICFEQNPSRRMFEYSPSDRE